MGTPANRLLVAFTVQICQGNNRLGQENSAAAQTLLCGPEHSDTEQNKVVVGILEISAQPQVSSIVIFI